MLYKQNLHTHSTYCDGKDNIEDIIIKAIDKGFNSIGFSSHAPMKGGDYWWAMKGNSIQSYINEIRDLKKKYENAIDVYCGLEMDLNSPLNIRELDYVIGSIHFLPINNELIKFDVSLDGVQDIINRYFNSSWLEYVEKYYKTFVEGIKETKVDIVGHLDLVSKHSEKQPLFDINRFEYKSLAIEALREIVQKCNVLEVNTGAISRSYRKTPYPARFLLEEIKRLKAKVVFSSDCHNMEYLDCYYNESMEMLKSVGINEIAIFEKGRFIDKKI